MKRHGDVETRLPERALKAIMLQFAAMAAGGIAFELAGFEPREEEKADATTGTRGRRQRLRGALAAAAFHLAFICAAVLARRRPRTALLLALGAPLALAWERSQATLKIEAPADMGFFLRMLALLQNPDLRSRGAWWRVAFVHSMLDIRGASFVAPTRERALGAARWAAVSLLSLLAARELRSSIERRREPPTRDTVLPDPADLRHRPLRTVLYYWFTCAEVVLLVFLGNLGGDAWSRTFALAAAGASFQPTLRNPFAANTVGEFWSRQWNIVTGRELAEGVYVPLLRRGVPRAAAGLATFATSGALHTLLIAGSPRRSPRLAAGMFSFFVVQGLLVLFEGATGARGKAWTTFGLFAPSGLMVEPFLAASW